MRSKLLGSGLGFIAILVAISVLYIGLVSAQTSTSTLTGNILTEAASTTADSISVATNATTSPALPVQQEIPEDKPEFLDRSAVEKELAKEFAKSKSAIVTNIDTGFSDSGNVSNKTSSQISDIKIYFHVYNPLRERALLTLNTGIRKGLLTYIRVEGSTGYKWEDDELVIAYIPLPAGSSGLVTLTATPLISGKSLKIQVTPVLKNEGGPIISIGTAETAFVRAKSPSLLKNFEMSISKHATSSVPSSAEASSTAAAPIQ